MTDISGLIESRLNGPADDRMIRYRGEWFDRGWLRAVVGRIQAAIDALGLEPGAPIGLAAQSRPEFIAAMLALLERQQTIVMLYAYQSGEALARKLRELALPAVIAATDQWTGPMEAAAREMGSAAIGLSRDAPEVVTIAPLAPGAGHALRAAPHEAGIELLTSGTTGPPKHFAISYDRLFRRVVLANSMKTETRQPVLLYFPLGNISGIYTLLPVIAADDQIILLDRFTVPDWLDYIRQVRPVATNLPPAAFRMILDAGVDPADLASIRYISSGAATVDPTLRREFEARYDVAILVAYGATEFGGVVAAVTPEHIETFGRAKSDSVGRPWGGASWRVVDVTTGEPLPAGVEGRIEVRAPAMSDTWIVTTDLGLIDEDGFLYHRGRLDGAIMRGGFKIIPEQVAEALSAHPAVAAAAVVGIDDARLGQVPAAAIQLREDQPAPTPADLEKHLRDRLPATMLPTTYLFVASLPRTPSLKIDMAAVRGLFRASGEAERQRTLAE